MKINRLNQLNRRRVEKWLISSRDFLNLSGIEKKLTLPHDSLSAYCRGKRKLKEKEISSLHNFIRDWFLRYDDDYDIDSN